MRAVKILGLLLIGLSLVVIAPAITVGQPGGFGKKGGGGSGGPGGFSPFGGGDPNTIFDYLAKGRPFFLISETRSLNAPLMQYAQEKGISSGQITRQQFLDFQDWRSKQGATPGGGMAIKGGPFGGGDKKLEMIPRTPGGGPPGTPPSPDIMNQMAEAEFKMRDRNADGRLIPDEMPGSLRGSLAKWDKNGDNLIDLNEFKEFYTARILNNDDQSATKGMASIIVEEEDFDKKPVVFRVGGKMPTGLPSWFKELDTDSDGQVALYEWRKGGKAMEEFPSWDLNLDGFITPDEAVKQQSAIAKSNTSGSGSRSMASSGEEGNGGGRRAFSFGKMGSGEGGSESSGERPQWKGFGGFPGGGFGKGGPQGGGKSGKKGGGN